MPLLDNCNTGFDLVKHFRSLLVTIGMPIMPLIVLTHSCGKTDARVYIILVSVLLFHGQAVNETVTKFWLT